MTNSAFSTATHAPTAIEYEIVRFRPDVRHALLKLLPDQELANRAGKLEWRFDRHPCGSGHVAIAQSAGCIVGLNTFIPSPMVVNGTSIAAYQSMDTIVHPGWRGHGIFTRLVQTFVESPTKEPCELIWGFPNANSASGFFGKLGWRHLGQVPFLVKPLRAGYFLRKLGLPLDFALSRFRDENAPTISRFEDDVNDLWSRFASHFGCGVARTRDFLNWRLFGWPATGYRVAVSRSSQVEAFVATCVADKHGGRIGYVMEAAGDRGLAALLRSELGRLREQEVEVVLAWCFPWSPNYAAHRAVGFLPLPERLRPIKINFGTRCYAGRAEATAMARSWYFSYLDSDTV